MHAKIVSGAVWLSGQRQAYLSVQPGAGRSLPGQDPGPPAGSDRYPSRDPGPQLSGAERGTKGRDLRNGAQPRRGGANPCRCSNRRSQRQPPGHGNSKTLPPGRSGPKDAGQTDLPPFAAGCTSGPAGSPHGGRPGRSGNHRWRSHGGSATVGRFPLTPPRVQRGLWRGDTRNSPPFELPPPSSIGKDMALSRPRGRVRFPLVA